MNPRKAILIRHGPNGSATWCCCCTPKTQTKREANYLALFHLTLFNQTGSAGPAGNFQCIPHFLFSLKGLLGRSKKSNCVRTFFTSSQSPFSVHRRKQVREVYTCHLHSLFGQKQLQSLSLPTHLPPSSHRLSKFKV